MIQDLWLSPEAATIESGEDLTRSKPTETTKDGDDEQVPRPGIMDSPRIPRLSQDIQKLLLYWNLGHGQLYAFDVMRYCSC